MDFWLQAKPLCITYPVLFELCNEKHITVFDFLLLHSQLTFTRWLPPFLFDQWLSIVNCAFSYGFDNSEDVVSWSWAKVENSPPSQFMTIVL